MRHRKPTKDTYLEVRQAIAKRILASPLAECIGYPGAPRDVRLSELTSYADGTNTNKRGWGFISIDLRRAGSNVNLYVNARADYESRRDEMELDDAGNEYSCFKLELEVNWPTHGACDPATALARLELYKQAALLAAEIQAEFGGNERYWSLFRTAEQRAEEEAKEKAEQLQSAVTCAVETVRKGMRAGGTAAVAIGALRGIPDGSYEHVFADGKRYQLEVKRTGDVPVGLVNRLS